jgi:hypothetical protein
VFSQTFNPFTIPVSRSSLLLRRNVVNYNHFTSSSPFAELCSLIMLCHQINSFPSFRNHFPSSSFPRPRPVREGSQRSHETRQHRRTEAQHTEAQFRQTHETHQRQHTEAQLRNAYGIAPDEDLYSGITQRANDQRHEKALRNNTDGGAYFKTVINDHIRSLPGNEKAAFKLKVEESDPEVFLDLSRLAVKKAISSSVRLTKQNTPSFMHKHLDQLEELRKKREQLKEEELKKEIGEIAYPMTRETDCIASMQPALQAFSSSN